MHLHQDLPASSGQSLRRHDLLNFIATLYEGDLHAKRVLSLANATLGVLTSASLAIHAVGRGLAQALGTLTKHGVKQVDRLLSNRGVDVWTFFARGDEPAGVRGARRVAWPCCFPPGAPDGAGGGGDARGVRVAGGSV